MTKHYFRRASDPIAKLAQHAASDYARDAIDLGETDVMSYLAAYFTAARRLNDYKYKSSERNRFEKLALAHFEHRRNGTLVPPAVEAIAQPMTGVES